MLRRVITAYRPTRGVTRLARAASSLWIPLTTSGPAVDAVAGGTVAIVVGGVDRVQGHRDGIHAQLDDPLGDLGPVQRDPVSTNDDLHPGRGEGLDDGEGVGPD